MRTFNRIIDVVKILIDISYESFFKDIENDFENYLLNNNNHFKSIVLTKENEDNIINNITNINNFNFYIFVYKTKNDILIVYTKKE